MSEAESKKPLNRQTIDAWSQVIREIMAGSRAQPAAVRPPTAVDLSYLQWQRTEWDRGKDSRIPDKTIEYYETLTGIAVDDAVEPTP